MAARDRFGVYADPGSSPLQRAIREFSSKMEVTQMIHTDAIYLTGRACDPQNYEPNLALNLEVADLINSKKGNA